MNLVVGHLLHGPPQHGVVEYAARVLTELQRHRPTDHRTVSTLDGSALGLDAMHVHFTDRLFGDRADRSASRFAAAAASFGVPLSVTLHDVPQPSDGDGRHRRADAYVRVANLASAVVVSSEHEKALLGDIMDVSDVEVIPLAVDVGTVPATAHTRLDVAMLGYLYPGKGHEEVLRALESLDSAVGFVDLGAPSDGHEDLATHLADIARGMNRRFEITGYLPDADLAALQRSVAVPIAHHRHMSASASIASWIGAGRRPLLPRTRYTDEIAARSPGTVQLFDDTPRGLVEAIESALSAPETTWISDGVRAHPSLTDVALDYQQLFDRCF